MSKFLNLGFGGELGDWLRLWSIDEAGREESLLLVARSGWSMMENEGGI